MKRTFTLLLLALAFLSVSAETKERALENRHEVRLGVGDHIFIPWSDAYMGKELDYKWTTQNIFLEYTYQVCPWLGIGLQYNMRGCGINTFLTGFPEEEKLTGEYEQYSSWNFDIMPVLRFTYYRSEWISLYASLASGFAVNYECKQTDDVTDYRTTTLGYNIYGSPFGIAVGKEHWFGTFEIGQLFAAAVPSERFIFALLERNLNLSVAYRF
ncbi:MAG: hypothetical protein IAA73_00390 [Bacteroidetes bacterium]|uniref:Outer membrane protein beta-barrel domain-containing protein n=1 Tax=Candidatus Gallipaludibacter merdavium TaxID=2840839 RepID=A0A9D9HR96_9BACT|nr:hypothetical protein [Candidatus Gallipaludibacter merdavium]